MLKRGADHGLHQRRVGGQARQHFAGLRGFEELRALPQHVGIDRVAQVGRDALAQPAHHVEARRREQAQRHGDGEQRQEVVAQRHQLLALVGGDSSRRRSGRAAPREHQRADRRHHQEQPGQRDAPAVGADEGQQAGQRAGRCGRQRVRRDRSVGIGAQSMRRSRRSAAANSRGGAACASCAVASGRRQDELAGTSAGPLYAPLLRRSFGRQPAECVRLRRLAGPALASCGFACSDVAADRRGAAGRGPCSWSGGGASWIGPVAVCRCHWPPAVAAAMAAALASRRRLVAAGVSSSARRGQSHVADRPRRRRHRRPDNASAVSWTWRARMGALPALRQRCRAAAGRCRPLRALREARVSAAGDACCASIAGIAPIAAPARRADALLREADWRSTSPKTDAAGRARTSPSASAKRRRPLELHWQPMRLRSPPASASASCGATHLNLQALVRRRRGRRRRRRARPTATACARRRSCRIRAFGAHPIGRGCRRAARRGRRSGRRQPLRSAAAA